MRKILANRCQACHKKLFIGINLTGFDRDPPQSSRERCRLENGILIVSGDCHPTSGIIMTALTNKERDYSEFGGK